MYSKTKTLEVLEEQKYPWGSVVDYIVSDVKGQLDKLSTETFTEEDAENMSRVLGQQYEKMIHAAIMEACTE